MSLPETEASDIFLGLNYGSVIVEREAEREGLSVQVSIRQADDTEVIRKDYNTLEHLSYSERNT